jgi:hypothetical protein
MIFMTNNVIRQFNTLPYWVIYLSIQVCQHFVHTNNGNSENAGSLRGWIDIWIINDPIQRRDAHLVKRTSTDIYIDMYRSLCAEKYHVHSFRKLELFNIVHFRSESLWRWHINTINEFMDTIHRPVFYLKTTFRRLDSVSFPRQCVQLGPIDRASPCLRTFRRQRTQSPKHF